jgi:hypothetical protein
VDRRARAPSRRHGFAAIAADAAAASSDANWRMQLHHRRQAARSPHAQVLIRTQSAEEPLHVERGDLLRLLAE